MKPKAVYTGRQAILTRYLPATSHKPSRIVAECIALVRATGMYRVTRIKPKKNAADWPPPVVVIKAVFDNGEVVRMSCCRPGNGRARELAQAAYDVRAGASLALGRHPLNPLAEMVSLTVVEPRA